MGTSDRTRELARQLAVRASELLGEPVPEEIMATRTDHTAQITPLRAHAVYADTAPGPTFSISQREEALRYQLAAELLELHDATGISLDNWETARAFVESLTHDTVTENGA